MLNTLSLFKERNMLRKKLKSKRTWKDRMEKIENAWDSERGNLLNLVKMNYQISGSCDECQTKKAVIKCGDCARERQFCNMCDDRIHSQYSLHNRNSFAKGYLEPLAANEMLDDNNEIVIVGM